MFFGGQMMLVKMIRTMFFTLVEFFLALRVDEEGGKVENCRKITVREEGNVCKHFLCSFLSGTRVEKELNNSV
jgi:hypothetical protein